MEQIKSLDIEQSIGTVTLSDGVTVLSIPKLSVLRLIKIVKWLGVDGSKLYSQFQETLANEELDDLEKFALLLENLEEEQLVKIFSIALDITPEDTLKMDINEMLEIILVYVENLDLGKTYSLVQSLYQKLFKKELPSFQTLLNQIAEQRTAAKEQKEPAQMNGQN
ncbi:hypothetical protein OCO53_25305 [Peribacillus frigoritolerans]|uniref:hypothetical protein n=1 Tax=Peribacillus frigoritolerans TaxID=450367 RepID=UPI0021D0B2AF|nr:hypothetical protein [Peribacillus frigoritolerans]MCU6603761.1 hypothetical protein [Peribacillus frigoritolerans]